MILGFLIRRPLRGRLYTETGIVEGDVKVRGHVLMLELPIGRRRQWRLYDLHELRYFPATCGPLRPRTSHRDRRHVYIMDADHVKRLRNGLDSCFENALVLLTSGTMAPRFDRVGVSKN
jgi:hypothetical protein